MTRRPYHPMAEAVTAFADAIRRNDVPAIDYWQSRIRHLETIRSN